LAALLLSFAPIGIAAAAADAPMTDAELAAERGGLRLPTGLEVGFGASVRTFVDGALVLETQLVWTDQGVAQTQSEPAAGASGDGGVVTLAGGAGALPGLILAGDGGTTVVLHELNSERIANVVVNTANNRDIRQEIQIGLTIPELSQFQQSAIQERANVRMLDAANVALRDAAVR
jgi:hypothetical protein